MTKYKAETIWERASRIADIVECDYGFYDGGDLALAEIHRDPSRSDEEIARSVAQLIAQP